MNLQLHFKMRERAELQPDFKSIMYFKRETYIRASQKAGMVYFLVHFLNILKFRYNIAAQKLA